MKRGQTTLEYVLLIGIAAAGIIAAIVYVSRGHQGNLRSQAEQLGAGQYAPGNTTINNNENKNLASIANSGSSTTVEYGNVNEPIPGLEQLYKDIIAKWKVIYKLRSNYVVGEWGYEELLVIEGNKGAGIVRIKGLDWTSPLLAPKLTELRTAEDELSDLFAAVDALLAARELEPRTPDKTTSTSYSSETGTITTHKDTSETLGDFGGDL